MMQRNERPSELVKILPFISKMDLAYNVADIVISRAGAISISELCIVGKAALFVPSPNVAEDHQTKNAMALVERDAAEMIRDVDAKKKLADSCLKLLGDKKRRDTLGINIKKIARPDACKTIVDEVFKLID
jgi:UDP-N-acetylglucosamine--N-acetylmuramyl-(pentapeptide) pyrophosphoryl-undecaprenol N-acetylglucosamine transferase